MCVLILFIENKVFFSHLSLLTMLEKKKKIEV
jgi:hypothetical protein